MTRPLLLLSLLVLLTAACSTSGAVGTPQATEAASDHRRAAEAQNSPEPTFQPHATATVDFVATQASMVDAIATANENNRVLQQQLIDTNNRGKEIEAQTAASVAAAEKSKLEQLVEQNRAPVELENAKRQRIEAENEQTRLQVKLLQAQNELGYFGAVYALVLLAICALLVMLRAMRRPHEQRVVRHTQDVTRPVVPAKEPGAYVFEPLPVTPDVMNRFLTYALTGAALGTNSVEAARVFKSTERETLRAIMEYLDKCQHIVIEDGQKKLNPIGRVYWTDWQRRYSPPTDAPTAQSAAYARHDAENHAMLDAGAGDAFGITDPATLAQFLPQIDVNAAIEPQEEGDE